MQQCNSKLTLSCSKLSTKSSHRDLESVDVFSEGGRPPALASGNGKGNVPYKDRVVRIGSSAELGS